MKSFEEIMDELEADLESRSKVPVESMSEEELKTEIEELEDLKRKALELWCETLKNIPSH